jgi:hypothetical protein
MARISTERHGGAWEHMSYAGQRQPPRQAIFRTASSRPYQRIDVIQHVELVPPLWLPVHAAMARADDQELQHRETRERHDYAHGRGPDFANVPPNGEYQRGVRGNVEETINLPRNYT